jgi:hypothetical protein
MQLLYMQTPLSTLAFRPPLISCSTVLYPDWQLTICTLPLRRGRY